MEQGGEEFEGTTYTTLYHTRDWIGFLFRSAKITTLLTNFLGRRYFFFVRNISLLRTLGIGWAGYSGTDSHTDPHTAPNSLLVSGL